MQLLLSDACEWTDVPRGASRYTPSVLLAMLVSLEAHPASPMITFVFHDGEHHHDTSFVKVSAARVFFHDPFGTESMLNEGRNRLGVASRAEADGTFSLSADEFESIIAAIVVAFIGQTAPIPDSRKPKKGLLSRLATLARAFTKRSGAR
jgi:hypothetical protein